MSTPVFRSTVQIQKPKTSAELFFAIQKKDQPVILSDERARGWLEKEKGESFEAKVGQVSFLSFVGQRDRKAVPHAVLVGLGNMGELNLEKFRMAGSHVWQKLKAEKIHSLAVDSEFFFALDPESGAEKFHAFVEGIYLSNYEFNKYKTSKKKSAKEKTGAFFDLVILTQDRSRIDTLKKLLRDVEAIQECVTLTRDFSNEPSNYGTPEYYAKAIEKIFKPLGVKTRVLNEAQCRKEGMNLFLSVGEGSDRESKFVIVDYNPRGAKKTIALVGKGVTFDSGGISIKPSLRMEDMKHDMTGAATLLGSLLLCARRKVQNRVLGFFVFTENMPNGIATQPGNVIYARNGASVEIINTDAEGRLILADALDFAQDYKPDVVVNAATLTGAALVALGKICAIVMSNDTEASEKMKRICDRLHERVWELPLYDEYFDDLKSEYADMRNSANDGYGGTIRGGMFLKKFIRNGTRWIHMDIAGTAYDVRHWSYCPKRGASGLHVRSVAKFAEEF